MLDTLISIQAYGTNASEAIDKVFQRIDEIEKKMSAKADYSEVIGINQMAGQGFSKVSPDTFFVIEKGLYYAKLSEGKFDITVGPLVNCGYRHRSRPTAGQWGDSWSFAAGGLYEGGNKWGGKECIFETTWHGHRFGGIAKGYAADEAAKVLRQNGITQGTINLGGNILVLGTKPDGSLWRIGIQNPFFKTRGSIMATVEVKDKTW